jgi:hypothetical protein
VLDNGLVNSNGNGTANGAVALAPPVVVYPAPQAAPPAAAAPPAQQASPETLIFRAGLLTPDQLGELVQERVSSGRTVEQIVVDRGWAAADAVARVLGLEPTQAEAPAPPVELATVAAAPPTAPPVEIAPPPVDLPSPPAAAVEPTPALQVATIPVEAPPVEPVHVEQVHVVPTPVEPTPVVEEQVEPTPVEPVLALVTELAPGDQDVEVEFCVVLRFAGQETIEIGPFADAAEAKAAGQAIAGELATAGAEWPYLGGRFVRPEAVLFVDVTATVR